MSNAKGSAEVRSPIQLISILSFLASILATGCASLPARPVLSDARVAQEALGSNLSETARSSFQSRRDAGVRLLAGGREALEARLQILRRAQRTIDTQYYFVADDIAGNVFLDELSRAAARGVKIRLLIDDLHTVAIDEKLRHLAVQPGVELRLFNPFCCLRKNVVTRFSASLFDLRRLNQRMHNKLLIADGSMAIAGGRNMADEYFGLNKTQEFIDLDALLVGEVVGQLSAIFVRYWNSEAAWPAALIFEAAQGVVGREGTLPSFSRDHERPEKPSWTDEEEPSIASEFDAGRVVFNECSAYAFADSPSKVMNDDEEYVNDSSVTTQVRNAAYAAKFEFSMASPYLIPRRKGMDLFINLGQRHVGMDLLTNSMASNDSVFAYAGYVRYRRLMLAQGARIFETRAIPSQNFAAPRPARQLLRRLHLKAVVIDRSQTFIGSMNFDPRSADKNTELGLWIDCPAVAEQVLGVFERIKESGVYEVAPQVDSPNVRWLTRQNGTSPEVTSISEPDGAFWPWLQRLILTPFIPESAL